METKKKPQQQPVKRRGQSSYTVGLTNANLMQTDFARIERQQWLRSMQLRMAVRDSLRGWLRKELVLMLALYRALYEHGPLHGMPHVFAILKRDAMEAFQ